MEKIEVLQEYLKRLYEAYDAFQEDYKNMHKRSKKHNQESVSEYYLRWRDKMRAEIKSVELVFMKIYSKPNLLVDKDVVKVKTNRLQNVA